MEDGEGRSGSSSGGAASQASVQPSREGQAHPAAAAAASRGQCGLKLLTHGFRRWGGGEGGELSPGGEPEQSSLLQL